MPGGFINAATAFNIDTFYKGIISMNNPTGANITGTCPITDMRGTLVARVHTSNSTTCGTQYFYGLNNEIYVRYLWAGEWHDWSLIYDHNILSNSTELASLASALGVNKRKNLGEDIDYNVIQSQDSMAYFYSNTAPVSGTEGFLMIDFLRGPNSGQITNIQRYYPYSATSVYYQRMYNWSTREWTSWYQVTMTAV